MWRTPAFGLLLCAFAAQVNAALQQIDAKMATLVH